MKKINEIEILAPAGSVSRMKAAFMAGADACYIGGNKFGARAYADNPSEPELIDAIGYAHFHKKKLFLAVNTLLKERELREELYDYILPYYEAGIDAVIVQDLGVLKFLSEAFPKLPLHASTQMTICDSTVIDELKKYNLERLVLSRELSLSEIASFKSTGFEIECFVHGALCVCYSGQCSMSYFNGGRSGNRGSCAGPCRVEYDISGEKKGHPLRGESYLLSPKDICSIDHIPEMVEAGIYSFKIEGRMKSPQYAALTSSLYRKWSDFYLQNGKEAFHAKEAVNKRKNDIKKLSDLYNRGSFTSGYFFLHNGKEMMADKRPNHNGILIGRVKKVGNSKKKNIVFMEAIEDLNPQDVLEIRDFNGVKPIYEFTLKDGYKPKETFFSNFTPGLKLKEGMEVYRTRNSCLIQEITEEFVDARLTRSLKMKVRAVVGESLEVTFSSGGNKVCLYGPSVQEAQNKPLEKERIVRALLKLGDTDFHSSMSEVEVELSENIFFPISLLNELRRQGTKELRDVILQEKRRSTPPNLPKEDDRKMGRSSGKFMILISKPTSVEWITSMVDNYSTNIECCFNMDLFPRAALFRSVSIIKDLGYPVFIRLPIIFRNEIALKYEAYFQSDKGRSVLEKIEGFMVRNLEEVHFVKKLMDSYGKNFVIIADTNLHVFNSEAASVLFEMGIFSYTVSLEHRLDELKDVVEHLRVPIQVSMIVYGREELMVTTQCQWKNKNRCVKELKPKDERLPEILYLEQKRKGKNGESAIFPVAKNCESCNNLIYMDSPLNYFSQKNDWIGKNVDRLRIDFTFESESEIKEVLKLAKLGK